MRARDLLRLCVCAAIALALASACGGREDERRKRALLDPPDTTAKAALAREKRRLFGDDGELLPSGEKVAGIMLPKGLTLYRHYEEHSFYKGDRIPLEKLENFFAPQLMSTTVERGEGTVKFGAAVPANDLKANRFDLYITRLRGAENATEVYVRETPAAPIKAIPPDQDEALQQRRKYAD